MTADALTGIFWLAGALIRVAALAAVVAGVALLVAPSAVEALSARLNRRAAWRRLASAWNRARDSEQFLYRHHRPFGAFLVAGAAYALLGLTVGWGPTVQPTLTTALPDPLAQYAANAALIVLVLGNGAALVFGGVMLVRPSRLKRIESVANTWISVPKTGGALDVMNHRIDTQVLGRPRLAGLTLVAVGLYLGAVSAWG